MREDGEPYRYADAPAAKQSCNAFGPTDDALGNATRASTMTLGFVSFARKTCFESDV
jgi:hypothetical protein